MKYPNALNVKIGEYQPLDQDGFKMQDKIHFLHVAALPPTIRNIFANKNILGADTFYINCNKMNVFLIKNANFMFITDDGLDYKFLSHSSKI